MELHKIVGFLLFANMFIQIITGFGYKLSKTKDWKLGFKKFHLYGAYVLIVLVCIQLVTVWNFINGRF